jgi:hypothetical protein
MAYGCSWPIPAVQAMKSIRGCPTATCDPLLPFRTVAILPLIDLAADIRREGQGGSR